MKKVCDKKGFTLAELLIVMAIILILAAIAIPNFTKQLESSRETADINAMRAAYSEAMTELMLSHGKDGTYPSSPTTVKLASKGSFTEIPSTTLEDLPFYYSGFAPSITAGKYTIQFTFTSEKVTAMVLTASS